MQGRSPAEVSHRADGTAEAAAQRLPLLYNAATQLLQGQWFRPLEYLCCVLRTLRGPSWLAQTVACWPLALAAKHYESLVRFLPGPSREVW